MRKSDFKWSQTVKSDKNCYFGITLGYSFFYLSDLFSGNLKIEFFNGRFRVDDNDRETTTCLNNIEIGKLEIADFDMETLDSRNLIWLLSLFYPRSQCRLVIYLFSYSLTLRRFSARTIYGPHRGWANSPY